MLSLFDDIECHTLWFPSQNYKSIQNLNDVGTDSYSLTPEWKNGIATLRKAIFTNIKPNVFADPNGILHAVNAPSFVSLLEMLVESINEDKMLTVVQTPWEYFVQKAGNEALHESVRILEDSMSRLMSDSIGYVRGKFAWILFPIIELTYALFASDDIGHLAHFGGILFGGLLFIYWRHKGAI